ncbi:hypothetical protein WJX73_008279 [Symbiochloris irregularis]|uniref:Myb-like domain-containing protein n=1 Tax=Symbiochloris irregularis TaxID=706552 RepID=A0AAW1PC74_9CHLO
MSDVKDILGMARPAPPPLSFDGEPSKATKAPKTKRPEGMSREAFALLGDSAPIVPSHLAEGSQAQGLKEKRKPSARGQVTYQWRKFKNEARTDGLELEHWVKCFRDHLGKIRPESEGEYKYAKYDRKMLVYRYDEEEWEDVIIKDPDWSREETDYLLSLCDLFDLRFILIGDRYQFPGGKPRTTEDLKQRYYTVARQLLIAREGGESGIANHVIIKHPFNAQHERQRKNAMDTLLRRTQAQEAADSAVLAEAGIIEAARKAEAAARRAAAPAAVETAATPAAASTGVAAAAVPAPSLADFNLPDFSGDVPPGTSSLFGPDVTPLKPAKPGVVARSAHMRDMVAVQLQRIPGGARAQKAFEAALAELGLAEPPTNGLRAVCGAWLSLRKEVIDRLEVARTLQVRTMDAGAPLALGGSADKRAGKRKASTLGGGR